VMVGLDEISASRTKKNVGFTVGGENGKAYRHGQFQG
jgi:hypothetical protein